MTCDKWLDSECNNAQNLIEEAEQKINALGKIRKENFDESYFDIVTIIKLANNAIDLCPENADIWFRRGNIYFEFKDLVEDAEEITLKSYQKAYELCPTSSLYLRKIEDLTK